MVFSSPIFLFYFLPCVLILYFLSSKSIYIQNVILFISSLVFYFWGEKEYVVLVMFSIMLNYFLGIWISGSQSSRFQLIILGAGVFINLSMLIYFKYYNFIINDFLSAFTAVQPIKPENEVHLPLGISFFTFHGLTYITDIYRKEAEVSRNPLNVGLYILFFPQLIAGPIVRYKDIDQQLQSRILSNEKLMLGIRRFIIGLAKKILIANTLGKIADDIYMLEPKDVSGSLSWLAITCYTLQIYFDFSGYSDMAIGLARMFGFDFLENFHFPYAARSIKEFWRRWHISLSTFFRDYVYKPLGGNRSGIARTYFNLMLVFFLTGLWHGASWNFIIWGLFHGLFLVIERLGFDKLLDRLPSFIAHLYTLLIVMVGWVFFRIEDMGMAGYYLQKMFFLHTADSGVYSLAYYLRSNVVLTLIAGFVFAFPIHVFGLNQFSVKESIWYDVVYFSLFILCLFVLSATTYNPFIYYRF
ncbi:MAG: MBOAT family protein [Chitinophagaceae bacterium]|nr:MBOAT family protein [Chitinophagaceae bacterium]